MSRKTPPNCYPKCYPKPLKPNTLKITTAIWQHALIFNPATPIHLWPAAWRIPLARSNVHARDGRDANNLTWPLSSTSPPSTSPLMSSLPITDESGMLLVILQLLYPKLDGSLTSSSSYFSSCSGLTLGPVQRWCSFFLLSPYKMDLNEPSW